MYVYLILLLYSEDIGHSWKRDRDCVLPKSGRVKHPKARTPAQSITCRHKTGQRWPVHHNALQREDWNSKSRIEAKPRAPREHTPNRRYMFA